VGEGRDWFQVGVGVERGKGRDGLLHRVRRVGE